jgi:hypothetical protein
LANTQAAAVRRFVFWRLFRPDFLLGRNAAPALDGLFRDQVVRERAIEKDFYREYRQYREYIYQTLVEYNPDFSGTRGQLVRLTQRFLDRCIFVLFCEDMGGALRYPPDLLRDMLIESSQSKFYDPDGSEPWDRLKALFKAMRTGGKFGSHVIECFNGGLFQEDGQLDNLVIPAKVFCAQNQGTSLPGDPRTLLYLSAAYNFGLSSGAGDRAISLYTLGRIFEQSITELEIMQANADGRESINLLSKRKTDGVYYTPEWVVTMVVEQTVGTRLDDIKAELGFAELPPLDAEAIAQYRGFMADKRRAAPTGGRWIHFLDEYRVRLDRVRIVDPACGSGAFLIQALNRMLAEYRWVFDLKDEITGVRDLFEQDSFIRTILAHNIYGVDINPESVEITKLALWLHTATPGKPLCSLDRNIRCGNSLVGVDFADFYNDRHRTLFSAIDPNKQELINAFDWQAAFPDVFSHGGFDCVVGNPPYIKLQNFRRVQEDAATYLLQARRPDGSPVYESTQTGNFDMYLPFIEKGLRLLRSGGRMGYIAPSVWLVNEYGRSLRQLIRRERQMDRWLDFKSHQIFDEAITYTSLQFFHAQPSSAFSYAFAPDGNTASVSWASADVVPYDSLPVAEAWTLAPKAELAFLNRLIGEFSTLGTFSTAIMVGIQTSADQIYHLQRIGSGRYLDRNGKQALIEDSLMRPLVSGSEAKRYLHPDTDTFLLFPYMLADAQRPRLYSAEEMAAEFPLGWAYLQSHEQMLRARENRSFDDDSWYRFGRNQNIDKQELAKLIVAQTVPALRVCYDHAGAFFLNNVRVNGILCDDPVKAWYLLGILNAPVCDYFFRRTAKPKEGGYFEANKQFIAPLPVPNAAPASLKLVADRAKQLQELHTLRRDTASRVGRRLGSAQMQPMQTSLGEDWIWAEVGTLASWKGAAHVPAGLKPRDQTNWAKAQHTTALQKRLDELDALLKPGAMLRVENDDDELSLFINDKLAIRLFDKPDTPIIAAQWRHALRDVNVTEAFDGRKLVRLLLDLRVTNDADIRRRMLEMDAEIRSLTAQIAELERSLNQIIYGLYGLTPEEVAMVEAG